MLDLNWYLDQARERAGLDSDRKLGAALGVSPTMPVKYRKGHALPDDGTMLRLATLAGVTHEAALCDLGRWRTKNPDVIRAYETLMDFMRRAAAALLLIIGITGTQPAQADTKALEGCILWKIFKRRFQQQSVASCAA